MVFAFGAVNLSQSNPRHHLACVTAETHLGTLIWRQPQSGTLTDTIPTSLNSFYSKQHLVKEQHVVLIFWHVSLRIVEAKAKGLKGIIEKTDFFNYYFQDL